MFRQIRQIRDWWYSFQYGTPDDTAPMIRWWVGGAQCRLHRWAMNHGAPQYMSVWGHRGRIVFGSSGTWKRQYLAVWPENIPDWGIEWLRKAAERSGCVSLLAVLAER